MVNGYYHAAVSFLKDLNLLESMMEKDIADGRQPTLVIAAAGSHMLGTSDNFERLQVLKDKFGFWLHLDGLDVAGLGLTEVTPALTVKWMASWC